MPSVEHVLGFGMTLKPGARIRAARHYDQLLGTGVIDNVLHQTARSAGPAQRRIGLDMGKLVFAVADTVVGPGKKPVFFPFEAFFFLVVPHFGSGALYIQGRERPWGTIHKVPDRA